MRGYRGRDDPAFLLLLCVFMSGRDPFATIAITVAGLPLSAPVVSAIGYGLWLQLPVGGVLCGWVWTVMGDCLATAALVALAMW